MSKAQVNGSLIVMKFGGTSIGDATRILGVADMVATQAQETRIILVVSAMGGVTEKLRLAAQAASKNHNSDWLAIGKVLRQKHEEVIDQALAENEQEAARACLDEQMKHFDDLCSGFALVREITPRALDIFWSMGEVISATLLAAVLRTKGLSAEAIDAAELIVTDNHFGDAKPLLNQTNARMADRLKPLLASGSIPVITGFRGATEEGLITTLGRSGSDYSASIVGAAIEADAVWIWTDVDGVMTADPRWVPGAHSLPEISYREAQELSFFGAKVLHPKTIQPLIRKSIPVWIKNTFKPANKGTKVSGASPGQKSGPRAITAVSQVDLITVTGKDPLGFSAMAARVFDSLARGEVHTLLVVQSSADNTLCFAIHHADSLGVQKQLRKTFALERVHGYIAIEVLDSTGVVVAIGDAMKGTPGIAGRLFGALGKKDVNLLAIAQGDAEISISLAVRAEEVVKAVQIIHDEFQL